MPMLVIAIANFFGISVFRLVTYAAIIVIVVSGLMAVRHYYVKIGYHKAIADVKKQDDRAVDAANKVEETAKACDDTNGYWDVITQNCKLGEEKKR